MLSIQQNQEKKYLQSQQIMSVVADSYKRYAYNQLCGWNKNIGSWVGKVYSYRPAIYTAVNGFVEESSQII